MSNDKTVEKQQIIDSQALIRSRLLRENGRFIPKEVIIQYIHNFLKNSIFNSFILVFSNEEKLLLR